MPLFSTKHPLSFTPADPLGAGLREDIAAEKLEAEAITLEEGVDEAALNDYWQSVEEDIKKDKSWIWID